MIRLYGTRRVGKTTLIRQIASQHPGDVLMLQGEDMQVSETLQVRTIENFKRLIGTKKIVIIDEAQAVPGIGQALKLMIDNIEGVSIIATGSSSFDLVAAAGEKARFPKAFRDAYPSSSNTVVSSGNYLDLIT